MNLSRSSGLLSATAHGLLHGIAWRLTLLWLLFLAIPTVLVAFPQWNLLTPILGHSVHAEAWGSGVQPAIIGDAAMALGRNNASPLPNFGLALMLTLLMSPFLTGMLVTRTRYPRSSFAELLQGGLVEYGRLFRLLLVSIIPMGIAAGLFAAATAAADEATKDAIYSADTDFAANLAMIFGAIVLLLAHATVEAGRAFLVVDGRLSSAFRAWWRGLKLLLRRPVATLGVYLLTTLISLLPALLFVWLRTKISAADSGGFLLAIGCTQLLIASLLWGRFARLSGLARLADSQAR